MNIADPQPEWIDLVSARLGGRALLANDEFFAQKENLVREAEAVFDPNAYTDKGKAVDGWETRRRREEGNDWCILRLGIPGRVHRFVVDTSFFRGNYPESCRLDGCLVDEAPSIEWLAQEAPWVELTPQVKLQGHHKNLIDITDCPRISHVRLNIFPDGGVARLRALGQAEPNWEALAQRGQVDLAALEHGGLALACSDMFFSDSNNLLLPRPSRNMGDGWETRRRRGPGHDWVVIRLGHPGQIERVVVDTSHFKGNPPVYCALDWTAAPQATVASLTEREEGWRPLTGDVPLLADNLHEIPVSETGVATHVRLRIYPDGGVARLRVYGRPRELPA